MLLRISIQQVLASEMDSQKAIQPFLKYPVLRRLVQQLTNDPKTDFDAWASNPRVIGLLQVLNIKPKLVIRLLDSCLHSSVAFVEAEARCS